MSDSVEDLVKKYKESIFYGRHPRSIGLFTIPEYPEYESERGMWSAALDAILTTLRYLAPATLLTLFWGQQSFFFRILKHIDSAFRAIVFSSEEQKRSVLEWLAEAGPVRVETLDTVWKHGWIVCGVLDAALPGACAGHPPSRLSMKHAQAIADHYLGVEPVFSRQELESNDALSKHQEWKLATYLDRIRQALGKLTPPVSKPTSHRTSPESTQFTLDYVAKGSGLTAAQINTKMYFKIYPTAQQAIDPGEITILIRGPKDTYGMTVLPPILGKAQLIRQNLLGLQSKQNFTESALPITQGAAYLRNYGKNDMNKTYFIPKTRYDIEIDAEQKSDHTKVSYKVYLEGRYEIYLTSRGQNIVGSPFSVTASKDIVRILERDSFCLEDGEEIDIVDVKTDRKVVLRIVDFVTEKMLLKENGTLEKISEAEAKLLMTSSESDRLAQSCKNCHSPVMLKGKYSNQSKTKKFNKLAHKIILMNRVCKVFNNLIEENLFQNSLSAFTRSNQQYIPDIVNSTFNEGLTNPFIVTEKVDKIIVPERLSVSICTEKSKPYSDETRNISSTILDENKISKFKSDVSRHQINQDSSHSNSPDSLDKSTPHSDLMEQDSIDRSTPLSATNPFLNDIYEENFNFQKDLPIYVTSEYEKNNSLNEEVHDTSIKIIIQPSDSLPLPSTKNPFINENLIELERPKSPVFKIISGQVSEQDDSLYIKTRNELISEDMLGNEFINPFFAHHHPNTHEQLPIADFIIGAPVSLPPIIRVPSPEPITDQMRSLSITPEEMRNERSNLFDIKNINEKVENNSCGILRTDFLSSNTLDVPQYSTKTDTLSVSSTFHSLDSTETVEQSNASTASEHQYELYNLEPSDRNSATRKDMWDSAYVSIDENNTSPDSNNNDNTTLCEVTNQSRSSPKDNKYGLKQEEITNMGPAEREIWETCNELNDNDIADDIKPNRWDFKRPTFTPIIEENDRSMSTGAKEATNSETLKNSEADTVTVAFAELNDIYQEYFPKSECISTTGTNTLINSNNPKNIDVEVSNEVYHTSVNSASEDITDVKRHKNESEGAISEVQADVTESVSVSPILQNEIFEKTNKYTQNKDDNQLSCSGRNIVLEKKKYWDEKIMQLEAKSKEALTLQRKRPASKQLKHDSLTKRKGKQIVKSFFNAGNYNQAVSVKSNAAKDIETKQTAETKLQEPITRLTAVEQEKADEKLVEKWKKYWDDRLESIIKNTDPVCKLPEMEKPKIGSSVTTKKQAEIFTETKEETGIREDILSNQKKTENKPKLSPLQIKQELLKQIKSEVKCIKEIKTKDTAYTPLAFQTRVEELNHSTNTINENKRTKRDIKDITAKITDDFKEDKFKPSPLPIKQEIPEEVYKAFETSPKRFFGTSRKHILNKIDTFLGKPNFEHKTSIDVNDTNQDSGLVSSRISLFLNLTNTEELPWARKKSQSPNDNDQQRDDVKNIAVDIKNSSVYINNLNNDSQFDKINKLHEITLPEVAAKESFITAKEEPINEQKLLDKKLRKFNSLSSSGEMTFTKSNEANEEKVLKYVHNKTSDPVQKLPQDYKHNKNDLLRRISISKSEMDIFNKTPNEPVDDYPDRYKSCDELPKINVKSFISLYESASKTSVDIKPPKRMYRTSSMDSQKCTQTISTTSDGAKSLRATSHSIFRPSSTNSDSSEIRYQSPKKLTSSKRSDTLSSLDTEDSIDIKVVKDQGIETTYVCLSDIELEIVESSPDQSVESSPEKTTVAAHVEYKNRFKSAKEYFQSLEELREIKKPRKLNECEILLRKQSTESLNDDKPQKRVKKKAKSRSLPSSEISKIWNQLQESQKEGSSTKLVKISEKFNVDDLFTDVMEGRLSRQGSLRGIPHKKAVLEAFRSMENISDKKLTSYELTASELNDFAKTDQGRNAQTYLSEYPYLPTTDPSKYHSRLDTKASGLISFKELLETRPRRNSVPDLRLNPKFTVDL